MSTCLRAMTQASVTAVTCFSRTRACVPEPPTTLLSRIPLAVSCPPWLHKASCQARSVQWPSPHRYTFIHLCCCDLHSLVAAFLLLSRVFTCMNVHPFHRLPSWDFFVKLIIAGCHCTTEACTHYACFFWVRAIAPYELAHLVPPRYVNVGPNAPLTMPSPPSPLNHEKEDEEELSDAPQPSTRSAQGYEMDSSSSNIDAPPPQPLQPSSSGGAQYQHELPVRSAPDPARTYLPLLNKKPCPLHVSHVRAHDLSLLVQLTAIAAIASPIIQKPAPKLVHL